MTQKLYIIVRTDMDSMTVGRIAAQASHAANQFVGELHNEIKIRAEESVRNSSFNDGKRLERRYDEWYSQTTSHFGTVIVLNGGSLAAICDLLNKLSPNKYFANAVIDPEYPIRDGSTIHVLENVLTCLYVFPIHDLDTNAELSHLNLL